MTTEVKKSFRAAICVLASMGAVGFGAIWRDHIASGSPDRLSLSLSHLVASNTNSPDLSETKFFEDIMQLLKKKYVDPIDDDTKLADGAVRGMIASLGDPNSLYMDPDQYRVYEKARAGKYEGIGADLVLTRDDHHNPGDTSEADDSGEGSGRLPKLVIAAVVPGSSADKAGLKPGDWAEFVDDHWVPNTEALTKLQALDSRLLELRRIPMTDLKSNQEYVRDASEYLKERKLLITDSEKSIIPLKARDRLMIGTSGEIKTQWERRPSTDRHP